MKNLTKFIILFALISTPLAAQIKINGYVGVGTYEMSQQKAFHQFFIDRLKNEYDIELALLDNFPTYFNYALEFQQTLNKTELSIGFIYQSSGARSFYKDYSGQINYDISITGYGPIIGIEKVFYTSKLLSISAKLKPQLLFSDQEFKSTVEIYDDKESETLKIKGYNIGIEPSVKLYHQFNKVILSFNAGYYLDIHRGQLKTNVMGEDVDVKIPNTKNALKNNWDGFRLLIGIGYQLPAQFSN